MEPTLTEFSYGYCVTEEFANRMGVGLKAAPYFPSLYTEGQKGGGFDVRVGSALFLQFKLCEKLTRRSAKETKLGLIDPPFYRFWLHSRKRSAQHQMLIDLEAHPGNQVYYIAPGFAELEQLNLSYVAQRVVDDSAMFSPTEMGPVLDDETHRVAFRLDSGVAWFLSEPHELRIHEKENILKRALHPEFDLRPTDREAWLRKLLDRMRQIIQKSEAGVAESLPFLDEIPEQRDPLHQVAYLARAYFSCEVFFVAQPR